VIAPLVTLTATEVPPTPPTLTATAIPAPTSTMVAATSAATAEATSQPTVIAIQCGDRTICDTALGVALTMPTEWQQADPRKNPPGELDFIIPPSPSGPANPDLRLVIRPYGITADMDDARAASAAADAETRAAGAAGTITRIPVRYAGTPGVLLRGVPSNGPVAEILLAHAGAVYRILASGNELAPDQREALDSLRFIQRRGSFPSANPPAPFVAPKDAVPVAPQSIRRCQPIMG